MAATPLDRDVTPSESISGPPSALDQFLDRPFRGLTFAFAWFIILLMVYLLWEVGGSAIPAIRNYGLEFLNSTTWDVNAGKFGILPEIWDTLYSSFLALVFGGFFGLVIPAQAGIQEHAALASGDASWIPGLALLARNDASALLAKSLWWRTREQQIGVVMLKHTVIVLCLYFFIFLPPPLGATIQMFLENPSPQQTVSGVGLLSGWAFSTQPRTPVQVRLRIDGQPTNVEIPCCTLRGDVAAAFPSVAPVATGFGTAVNYSELTAGLHTIGVEITAAGEGPFTIDFVIEVIKPGTTNFVAALDLRAATVAIDDGQVLIADARVRNDDSTTTRTNLRLQYSPSLQSFALSDSFNADTDLFWQVQSVFSSCTFSGGCHGSDNPQANLRLSSGAAFANLVAVRSTEVPTIFRVNPGKPEESYLLQKIARSTPPVGGQMPLGGPPLSQEQIEVIRRWITAGAPPP